MMWVLKSESTAYEKHEYYLNKNKIQLCSKWHFVKIKQSYTVYPKNAVNFLVE